MLKTFYTAAADQCTTISCDVVVPVVVASCAIGVLLYSLLSRSSEEKQNKEKEQEKATNGDKMVKENDAASSASSAVSSSVSSSVSSASSFDLRSSSAPSSASFYPAITTDSNILPINNDSDDAGAADDAADDTASSNSDSENSRVFDALAAAATAVEKNVETIAPAAPTCSDPWEDFRNSQIAVAQLQNANVVQSYADLHRESTFAAVRRRNGAGGYISAQIAAAGGERGLSDLFRIDTRRATHPALNGRTTTAMRADETEERMRELQHAEPVDAVVVPWSSAFSTRKERNVQTMSVKEE